MKICFVGPGYKSLKGISEGGSERQIALLAHHLSNHNHTVVFVATGPKVKEVKVGRVSVLSGWESGKGVKGLRFITSYMPTLYKLLININADIYYIRGYSLFAAVVVKVANVLKSMSIVALASDSDLSTVNDIKIGNRFTRCFAYGCLSRRLFIKHALKKATVVAAQTEEQVNSCNKLRLQAIRIPNAIDIEEYSEDNSIKKWDLVWIGHISLRKGVDKLLTLATELPEMSICVVGDVIHETLRPELIKLSKLSNVLVYRRLTHKKVLRLISTSKVVINTSPLEGYSNVFLEAWLQRTPVVSLNANPNSLLSKSDGFGYCANGSVERMKKYIKTLTADENLRMKIGLEAQKYVLAEHSLAVVSHKIVDAYNCYGIKKT